MSYNASVPSHLISKEAPQEALPVESGLASIGNPLTGFFEWFGELGMFAWKVMRSALKPPFEGRELFRQLDEIGSKSLPLVALGRFGNRRGAHP